MTFFYEFDILKDEMSSAQYGATLTFQWIIAVLYFVLFCLILVNIRMILIKLQKWKTLAMLFFYIWSFLAILTRLILNVYGDYQDDRFVLLGFCQIVAKLCAGLT